MYQLELGTPCLVVLFILSSCDFLQWSPLLQEEAPLMRGDRIICGIVMTAPPTWGEMASQSSFICILLIAKVLVYFLLW